MIDLPCTWPCQSSVFGMNNGVMYIFSNRSMVAPIPNYDGFIDEDDRNSCYQCYWFPVDDLSVTDNPGPKVKTDADPTSSVMYKITKWRRDPFGKPDFDAMWAKPTLQEGEYTGALVAVESRTDSTDESDAGTYEFKPLVFLGSDDMPCTQSDIPGGGIPGCSRTNDKMGQPRGPLAHSHPGYDKDSTKYRAYNLSCSPFIDVTFDDMGMGGAKQPQQQIHLRIGSRLQASALDDNVDEVKLKDNQDTSQDHRVTVWPPADAARPLIDMLNPFGDETCTLSADSDERSVIYMV